MEGRVEEVVAGAIVEADSVIVTSDEPEPYSVTSSGPEPASSVSSYLESRNHYNITHMPR